MTLSNDAIEVIVSFVNIATDSPLPRTDDPYTTCRCSSAFNIISLVSKQWRAALGRHMARKEVFSKYLSIHKLQQQQQQASESEATEMQSTETSSSSLLMAASAACVGTTTKDLARIYVKRMLSLLKDAYSSTSSSSSSEQLQQQQEHGIELDFAAPPFADVLVVNDGVLESFSRLVPPTVPIASIRIKDTKGCKITDRGIAHLAHLARLESLSLQRCLSVTDRGFAQLFGDAGAGAGAMNSNTDEELSQLLLLSSSSSSSSLPSSSSSSSSSLASSLRSLDLSWCAGVKSRTLRAISANCVALERLILIGCYDIPPSVEAWSPLRRLASLVELDLSCCYQITDEVLLSCIAPLVQEHPYSLERLRLSNCRMVTKKGLKPLLTIICRDHHRIGANDKK